MDGIVSPGERVNIYHKLINKAFTTQKVGENELPVDKSVPIRAPPSSKFQPVHIERVLITEDASCRLVKLSYRQTRRPELGDKFSSRHGQKGVTGRVENSLICATGA